MGMRATVSDDLRRRLANKYGNSCVWCSKRLQTHNQVQKNFATLDHLKPRITVADDSERNLVLACKRCNERRGHTHAYLFYLLQLAAGRKPRQDVLLPKLRGTGLLPLQLGSQLPATVEELLVIPLKPLWRARVLAALPAEMSQQ